MVAYPDLETMVCLWDPRRTLGPGGDAVTIAAFH